MLFSIASPTLAASIFAHRADVGARILGVAAASPALSQDAAPRGHDAHHGHHDHAGPAMPADEQLVPPAGDGSGSEHAAHGSFCSFCLTASSIVALTGADSAAIGVRLCARPAPAAAGCLVISLVPLVLRARGPPPFSRS